MRVLAILASLSLLFAAAHAQSLRKQLDAANRTTDRLMMAKDTKRLAKHWKAGATKDFKYVEQGRTMDMDGMAAGMAMGLGGMRRMVSAGTQILSLKEKGATATATVSHRMTGITAGPDGKPHTTTFGGTSAQTYVKQGGKWRLSRMSWLSQSMTVDGKPVGAGGK